MAEAATMHAEGKRIHVKMSPDEYAKLMSRPPYERLAYAQAMLAARAEKADEDVKLKKKLAGVREARKVRKRHARASARKNRA